MNRASIVDVFGDLVIDVVVTETSTAERLAGARRERIEFRVGGGAANFARALARGSFRTRLHTLVGRDSVGMWLRSDMTTAGVELHSPELDLSGIVLCQIYGSEVAYVYDPRMGDIERRDRISSTSIPETNGHHHWSGYWIADGGADLLVRRLTSNKNSGKSLSLDLGDTALASEFGRHEYGQLLQSVAPDLVFCNAEEAETVNVADLARRISTRFVVTNDVDPITVFKGDKRLSYPVVPNSALIGAIGNGDAFAAGFLEGWLAQQDDDGCIASGISRVELMADRQLNLDD